MIACNGYVPVYDPRERVEYIRDVPHRTWWMHLCSRAGSSRVRIPLINMCSDAVFELCIQFHKSRLCRGVGKRE